MAKRPNLTDYINKLSIKHESSRKLRNNSFGTENLYDILVNLQIRTESFKKNENFLSNWKKLHTYIIVDVLLLFCMEEPTRNLHINDCKNIDKHITKVR